MSVSVKANYGGGSGIGNLMRIGELGVGIATGNPMLIAGGALAGSNAPAAKAFGAYNTATNLFGGSSGESNQAAYDAAGTNALGGSEMSANLAGQQYQSTPSYDNSLGSGDYSNRLGATDYSRQLEGGSSPGYSNDIRGTLSSDDRFGAIQRKRQMMGGY